MTNDEVVASAMKLTKAKGFGTIPDEINVGEKLALIHSEVSEVLQAYRKNKGAVESELADIIIRVAHLAGVLGADLEGAITKKFAENDKRNWDWDPLVKRDQ